MNEDEERKDLDNKEDENSVANDIVHHANEDRNEDTDEMGDFLVRTTEVGGNWKKVKWDAVLKEECDSDHIFMRSGLIRKDLIPKYAGVHMPLTFLCSNIDDVRVVAEGCTSFASEDAKALAWEKCLNLPLRTEDNLETNCLRPTLFTDCWVLKLPDSSNAYGIQFFHMSEITDEESRVSKAFCAEKVWVIQQYLTPCLLPPLPKQEGEKQHENEESHMRLTTEDIENQAVLPPEAPDEILSKKTTAERESICSKSIQEVEKRDLMQQLSYGHKFHIRALVLVVGVMDVFIYKDSRVLIATEMIESPLKPQSLQEDFAHITNRSYNERHEHFHEGSQNISLEQLEIFNPYKDDSNKTVLQQMKNIIKALFRELSEDRRHFFTMNNCFELFGLDFLVDKQWAVYLLEANPEPSLSMFNKSREEIIPASPLEERLESFNLVYSQSFDRFIDGLKKAAGDRRHS